MNSAFYLISKRLLQFLNYMILLQDMSFFELKLNPFTCELLIYLTNCLDETGGDMAIFLGFFSNHNEA